MFRVNEDLDSRVMTKVSKMMRYKGNWPSGLDGLEHGDMIPINGSINLQMEWKTNSHEIFIRFSFKVMPTMLGS